MQDIIILELGTSVYYLPKFQVTSKPCWVMCGATALQAFLLRYPVWSFCVVSDDLLV